MSDLNYLSRIAFLSNVIAKVISQLQSQVPSTLKRGGTVNLWATEARASENHGPKLSSLRLLPLRIHWQEAGWKAE